MVGELNKLQLQVTKFRPTMGPAKVCMGIEMMPCQVLLLVPKVAFLYHLCDAELATSLVVRVPE